MCVVFAVVGVAVLDDYGRADDEQTQRQIAQANAEYIAAGNADYLYNHRDFRYYGVVFEMPLLLVERALRLQDTRHIYLMRHLLTHLFFIAGGFVCGMLAYRMMSSRWIALFAMMMFLLHPRLYAHSFFNTKDIPFATMLVITLYLTHRAFRRGTIGVFLLCGIVVGLAINMRPFALMLLPMLLAMRGLDLWRAGMEERKRILATAGIFAAAALATAYITHPYYWENPLRFVEGIRVLSQHPTITENLFMGEIYRSDAVPWNYIPVWFAITAPPLTLLLGALGSAAVCWQAIAHPLHALRDRETRFRILLLGCFALPVAAVIALQSNIYHGWRHMYFLWAPFCLLAAVGLRYITNISVEEGIWKLGARLPVRIRGGGRLHMAQRGLAHGVAGAGLATTLTAMAALHPHQQVYFNALVDTGTPGALAERYTLDYFHVAQRESLEHLLARYPDGELRVHLRSYNAQILPQDDRKRIAFSPPYEADFYINRRVNRRPLPDLPAFYYIQAYGSSIGHVFAPTSAAYRNAYLAAYHDVASNGTLLARSDFDIYAHNGALHYLNANCAPPRTDDADDITRIFLHIFPSNPADLPPDGIERDFENRDFYPNTHLTFLDGKCIYKQALPDYPIARIATGEHSDGAIIWRADINLAARAAAQAAYDSIANGDYGQPVAQSDFDVYLRGDTLAYLKTPCAPGDADARFFLHIIPVDPADLSGDWHERGFDNLDFQFADHGAYAGDKCVIQRELPGYAIERIHTGQFVSDEGVVWSAEFDPAAHDAAQALYDSVTAGDYGQPLAQSDFDVYLRGDVLAYLKEDCEAGDADARFFLHIIPANPADLPAIRRERGFANLDFQFADRGARIGGKCVATHDLPDYAIERIRTGQFVSGEGSLWRVEFAAGR